MQVKLIFILFCCKERLHWAHYMCIFKWKWNQFWNIIKIILCVILYIWIIKSCFRSIRVQNNKRITMNRMFHLIWVTTSFYRRFGINSHELFTMQAAIILSKSHLPDSFFPTTEKTALGSDIHQISLGDTCFY